MHLVKILLVEDDETYAELFARAVQQTGIKVHLHTVTDARGGFEYLTGRGIYRDRLLFPFPDFVVLGLLQDSSGLDFLKNCREVEACKRLPMFVLTGTTEEDEQIDKALRYGATDVFFKPESIEGLTQVVQEMLCSLDGGQQALME